MPLKVHRCCTFAAPSINRRQNCAIVTTFDKLTELIFAPNWNQRLFAPTNVNRWKVWIVIRKKWQASPISRLFVKTLFNCSSKIVILFVVFLFQFTAFTVTAYFSPTLSYIISKCKPARWIAHWRELKIKFIDKDSRGNERKMNFSLNPISARTPNFRFRLYSHPK